VLGIRTRDLLVTVGARAASLTGSGRRADLVDVLDLRLWAGARSTA
jgi:hypothetical protein